MYAKNQEESTQETGQESQSWTLGEMQHGAREEKEGTKQAADRIVR